VNILSKTELTTAKVRKKYTIPLIIFIFVTIITLILFLLFLPGCNDYVFPANAIHENTAPTNVMNQKSIDDVAKESIKICSFNAQIFGTSKANDANFMTVLKSKVEICDTFFLLEIRDSSGDAFKQLCDELPEYNCLISMRDGRSSSKEQIGVLTKINSLNVISTIPDTEDVWERSPVLFNQIINNTQWNFYIVHIKPDDVKNELIALEKVVNFSLTEPIMIIGDFNADCVYYDSQKEPEFDDWVWAIQYDDDTTSGNTNCAYDRIVMNQKADLKYVAHGIDNSITPDISDHYLVWAAIK